MTSQAIFDMDYNGGGTYTSSAIEHSLVNKFKPSTGIRSFTPHLTMVITDGQTQEFNKLPGN